MLSDSRFPSFARETFSETLAEIISQQNPEFGTGFENRVNTREITVRFHENLLVLPQNIFVMIVQNHQP